MDYPLIYSGIVSLSILIYVVLDGFDLGVGMIFNFLDNKNDKDVAMSSLSPVWDGNETWLIMGGGGLFAAFPLAYAIIMPAFYIPILFMLIGLILRGVSFEYRFKAKSSRYLWDKSFMIGSLMASFSQGIMVGALLQGIVVENNQYAGGWFDWLNYFTVFTGFALTVGYIALGCGWLIIKTENELQKKAVKMFKMSFICLLLSIAFVSLYLPLTDQETANKWFTFPASLLYWIIPFLLSIITFTIFSHLERGKEYTAYIGTIIVFILSFAGFLIHIFPYIVPKQITLYEAASPTSSLEFLFVGIVLFLPVIIIYTSWTYFVFRGKTRIEDVKH
jgi:cytochrome d ubiquinol oxidase subunit II